jgi:hypothetical protein
MDTWSIAGVSWGTFALFTFSAEKSKIMKTSDIHEMPLII